MRLIFANWKRKCKIICSTNGPAYNYLRVRGPGKRPFPFLSCHVLLPCVPPRAVAVTAFQKLEELRRPPNSAVRSCIFSHLPSRGRSLTGKVSSGDLATSGVVAACHCRKTSTNSALPLPMDNYRLPCCFFRSRQTGTRREQRHLRRWDRKTG